jgi:hypothetical protein
LSIGGETTAVRAMLCFCVQVPIQCCRQAYILSWLPRSWRLDATWQYFTWAK